VKNAATHRTTIANATEPIWISFVGDDSTFELYRHLVASFGNGTSSTVDGGLASVSFASRGGNFAPDGTTGDAIEPTMGSDDAQIESEDSMTVVIEARAPQRINKGEIHVALEKLSKAKDAKIDSTIQDEGRLDAEITRDDRAALAAEAKLLQKLDFIVTFQRWTPLVDVTASTRSLMAVLEVEGCDLAAVLSATTLAATQAAGGIEDLASLSQGMRPSRTFLSLGRITKLSLAALFADEMLSDAKIVALNARFITQPFLPTSSQHASTSSDALKTSFAQREHPYVRIAHENALLRADRSLALVADPYVAQVIDLGSLSSAFSDTYVAPPSTSLLGAPPSSLLPPELYAEWVRILWTEMRLGRWSLYEAKVREEKQTRAREAIRVKEQERYETRLKADKGRGEAEMRAKEFFGVGDDEKDEED